MFYALIQIIFTLIEMYFWPDDEELAETDCPFYSIINFMEYMILCIYLVATLITFEKMDTHFLTTIYV